MNAYKSVVRLEPTGDKPAEFSLRFIAETHSKLMDMFLVNYLVDCDRYTVKHGIITGGQTYMSDSDAIVRKYNKREGINCGYNSIKFMSIYTVHNAINDGTVDVLFAFPTATDMVTLHSYLTPALGKAFIKVKHYRRNNSKDKWWQTSIVPSHINYPENGVGSKSDSIK